jgi:hypothetical protein
MPIIERTPYECFNAFAEHLRGLVAATVTERYPLSTVPANERMILSFREEIPVAVPIETAAYGRLYFYLGQALEAVVHPEGYRLKTRQYWYRIQLDGDLKSQAALRWEYDATTAIDDYARHHAQLSTAVALGGGKLDLNRAHLPTGWVTIEEVIRFLIVDLGMSPPCGDDWPNVVRESERKFYEDFTGKRYEAPSSP